MKHARMIMTRAAAVAIAAGLALGGCGDSEKEELDRQVQAQIKVIEEQLTAVEQHQEAMQAMIEEMSAQIVSMKEELNREGPRIHAANSALESLRILTAVGLGESPLESTLKEPGWSMWNVLWLLLFVFILWLLYRIRAKNSPGG